MTKPHQAPASTSPPYSKIGKDGLTEMRLRYVADLAKPNLSPVIRMAIQEELRMINAALKAVNIAQSQRDLNASVKRRTAGAQGHLAATTEALSKATAVTVNDPVLHASMKRIRDVGAALVATESARSARAPETVIHKSGYPKGIQSLGGLILMRAQQLRSALRKIRTVHAEHTDVFLDQLDVFIAAQDAMVKSERAEAAAFASNARASASASSAPDESTWKETWQHNEGDRP